MAVYEAWFEITNRTHLEVEADSLQEAEKVAKKAIEDGAVLEQFGYEQRDLNFRLSSITQWEPDDEDVVF